MDMKNVMTTVLHEQPHDIDIVQVTLNPSWCNKDVGSKHNAKQTWA